MADVNPIPKWHKLIRSTNPAQQLEELLADDCVFHSPVLHAPQKGKKLTLMYLSAAFQVLVSDTFRYEREIIGKRDAMLEFVTVIDGITINGVDVIKWNDAGKIIDFKVIIRPLKGLQKVQEKMAAMLAKNSPSKL